MCRPSTQAKMLLQHQINIGRAVNPIPDTFWIDYDARAAFATIKAARIVDAHPCRAAELPRPRFHVVAQRFGPAFGATCLSGAHRGGGSCTRKHENRKTRAHHPPAAHPHTQLHHQCVGPAMPREPRRVLRHMRWLQISPCAKPDVAASRQRPNQRPLLPSGKLNAAGVVNACPCRNSLSIRRSGRSPCLRRMEPWSPWTGAGGRDQTETPLLRRGREQLHAYFDGTLQAFDLPLAPAGSAYRRRIWQELSRIPFGETRSYAAIALCAGGSARSVGGANGANPIPIVIPCHRVVGATGIGGYSGGEGLATKRFLLALEQRYAQPGFALAHPLEDV